MFGEVWNWAGEYRRNGKNISIEHRKIPVELHNLCNERSLLLVFGYGTHRFHHKQ
jgi:fido (protein-threonine AMPylation protein)